MQNSQNTTTPIVSFIVTYHNENVEMLTECLKSILSLSFAAGEREVILIDDGSDVSPINEIEDFRDDILYLRQPNRGLSEARNAGIDLARGEYIQFVDADDYLIKLSYELCLGLLKRERPDVVVFNFTKEEGDTDAPNLFDGPMTGSEYMRSRNLRACAWGYLFRKNMLISLRFTPGLLHEDEEFTPQLILRAETLYSTDNCAYFYRERENSIVHNNDKEWILKRLDDAEHVIFSLDHLAATQPMSERVALQRRVAQLTMDYIYNIITLTHSEKQLESRLQNLRRRGMFPLPRREYTLKYDLFRRMTNSPLGRKALLHTLPYLKRER